MKSRKLMSLLILIGLLIPAIKLWGQQPTGRITGVVTDATGAVVPGALVRLTNTLTGVVQQATTNNAGLYVLAPVAFGDYTLESKKEGLEQVVHNNIHIDVNAAMTIDLVLQVGAASETVTVNSASSTINTLNPELGNYRSSQQLETLPVAVREVGTLVSQSAGVPYGSTDTAGGTYSQGSRSFMQVVSNGVQLNPLEGPSSFPSIDGLGRRADTVMPNIDTIAEMKVITNGTNAEYSAPTAIVAASKSGTNQVHGGLYEFYESGGLSTRTWNIPTSPSFVRHQFGGTVGGPIKKDRMFFFGGVDIFSYHEGLTTPVRFPTAAEANGDLSDLLTRTVGGVVSPIVLQNPLTGEPFPGNIIPPGMISPVSQALLKTIPTGPATPADNIGAFNSTFFKPLADASEKYDMRYDYDPNVNNQIYAMATIAHLNQASRFEGSVPGAIGFTMKKEWTQVVVANWTRTFNPSTLMTVYGGWRNEPFENTPSQGNVPFTVPIQGLTPEPPYAGPPSIQNGSNGAGISDLFGRLLYNYSQDYSYQIDPSITKMYGHHSFKAGFTFLHGVKTEQLASPPYGAYTTSSDYNNPSSTISATGDAFADLLLGYPSTTDTTAGPHGGFTDKTNYGFYVQDTWTATRNLTLNLGLRYDKFGFFFPTDLREATGDVQTGQIIIPSGSSGLIQPAFQPYSALYVQANQLGLPNSLIKPNNTDFNPRFGFAYRIRPALVVRGGFGVYSNDFPLDPFENAINAPPFVYRAKLSRSLLLSQGVNVNSLFTFQNPSANGSTAGAASAIAGVTGMSQTYPTQKAYTWNLTVEKQLPYQIVVRVSTIGTLGRNLSLENDLNACVPGPVTCLQRAATDPTARRWQQFGIAFGSSTAGGTSNYNSGEIEVSKQFSNGLLFDANYSYSRLFSIGYLDPSGDTPAISNPFAATRNYDYGPNFVQPYNIFHWNYVYQLPVGTGQRFGGSMGRLADAFLGRWEISGMLNWQSGSPLTILAGTGQNPSGTDAPLRANRVGRGTLSHSGQNRNQMAQKWFDTSAYTVPAYVNPSVSSPAQQFGTAGIGTVIGPSFSEYDMTLVKRLQIKERFTLQLRVDAFDIFNIPMLGNPDTNVADPTFGQILTANSTPATSGAQTGYTPRTFQGGIRLNF
jgi:hypothetical protein